MHRLALALAFMLTMGAPFSATAQPSDRFAYDPNQGARDEVRARIIESDYDFVESVVWADINGGVRSRSAVARDPRLKTGCLQYLNSSWFRQNEKMPLCNRMVQHAIDAVLAGAGPH